MFSHVNIYFHVSFLIIKKTSELNMAIFFQISEISTRK